ncbi:3-(3-hydroxy-phenyl)propionate hydroxylase [Dokdonella fugitiva]|uniref:3-(3-hydroxy-phenyl)propionate hydroxylase n=1 Tax=Dokdonella fugitiva TaxID=328517 RepID=A0A839EY88_9GAMM|nr:FAD-dependent monooxygenase [Dokdonella fugitiva]MBA8886702.1 3-(3-hydroxy-phenyl)propionate hydroxylase [Dokdonella fugitiva]
MNQQSSHPHPHARGDYAVVIAGGGPTGLMLAGELALAGIDVAIAERRATQDLEGSRGGGLHTRTIEVLDQRGIAERFIAQGTPHPVVHVHPMALDISDAPTRHPYTLGLWQNHTERTLADWVRELGVPILREREVSGFAQDDDGVDVKLADGTSLRAQYLVGCDGGRSTIRKTAGIAFPGWDATKSWLIAEARMSEEPQYGFREDAFGAHGIGKSGTEGLVRLVLTERELHADGEPSLREISEALVTVYGNDFGIHDPIWISRFTDMTRQAATYRDRRVLLAGDAAHVHPPVGGQGLNLGVQDAVNLGWKLAQVIKRTAPESLLDTYHAERHAVGARVLRNTMAQVALSRVDERTKALSAVMVELLGADDARRRFAAEMSGLAIRYDLGEGHPLLGRRMPDLDLVTAGGPLRVFTLLHDARPLLLNFGAPGDIDVTAWSARVWRVDARCEGSWELPAIGTVPAPSAVLVRPDGYVAWVGEGTQEGLADALVRWFGSPKAA